MQAAMPNDLLEAIAGGGAIARRLVDLGDPGSVVDGGTPRDQLPPYEGPADPTGGRSEDWGAPVAATPDDAPVAGPARASAPRD